MARTLRIRSLVTLLTLASFAACDSVPSTAPTARNVGADAPQLAVTRGETLTFLVHLDAEAELMSIHAPSTLCSIGPFNVADVQFVTTPSAIGQFIAQVRDGDEQLAVYHATTFEEAGLNGAFNFAGFAGIANVSTFCAFLQGPALIAEGTVRRISNLSNVNFSASWTGTVESPTGGLYRLREIYQLTADAADPSNQELWRLNQSSIHLAATP